MAAPVVQDGLVREVQHGVGRELAKGPVEHDPRIGAGPDRDGAQGLETAARQLLLPARENGARDRVTPRLQGGQRSLDNRWVVLTVDDGEIADSEPPGSPEMVPKAAAVGTLMDRLSTSLDGAGWDCRSGATEEKVMVRRRRDDETTTTREVRREVPIRVRGGVSLGSVLTGVVVALGALVLLSGLVAGALGAFGYAAEDVTTGDIVNAGVGAGIALVLAQFLAYLWGGYTAGRMGRGAGALNGFLVPLVAIIVAVIVGAVVNALNSNVSLSLPFTNNSQLVDYGTVFGIAALIAMFVGGILGGALGQRWHTKLERKVEDQEAIVEPTAAPAPSRATEGSGRYEEETTTRERDRESLHSPEGEHSEERRSTTTTANEGSVAADERRAEEDRRRDRR